MQPITHHMTHSLHLPHWNQLLLAYSVCCDAVSVDFGSPLCLVLEQEQDSGGSETLERVPDRWNLVPQVVLKCCIIPTWWPVANCARVILSVLQLLTSESEKKKQNCDIIHMAQRCRRRRCRHCRRHRSPSGTLLFHTDWIVFTLRGSDWNICSSQRRERNDSFQKCRAAAREPG